MNHKELGYICNAIAIFSLCTDLRYTPHYFYYYYISIYIYISYSYKRTLNPYGSTTYKCNRIFTPVTLINTSKA